MKLLAYEGDTELSEHPFLKVLSRPNPWQSGPELVDALISYFKLAGDGFLEAVELDGDIRELYALRPDRMKAIAGRRGYPVAPAGKANLAMSTNQLAERFGAVSMTLEMPFKDNADLPDPGQGWSPERSAQLGWDCMAALLEWLDA